MNGRTAPTTVRGVVIDRTGGPDVLQPRTLTLPAPGPGEVLVRHERIGVNFTDIYQRRGTDPVAPPFTPGMEAAGIIETVGADVPGFHPGDRVAYARWRGSYAEAAIVPATSLIPLPDDVSFEQGAAFGMQGITAQYLITEFRKPSASDTVLVHAAAGGVGLMLVQFAKHSSARVIGTVSTQAKADAAREAGADEVINYTDDDFAETVLRLTDGHGADLIIDGVGKATFNGDLRAVATHGNIVVFGAASGPSDPLSPGELIGRSRTVSGGDVADGIGTHDELLARAKDVLDGIEQGWLTSGIHATLPLEDAAEAHRLLEERHTMGKILLNPTI
ncbi:quinone oxidoreductase [Brevibacterium sediminis]|uniref:quinone oxidoreductase family protein n=1 Tax=Brevibacterium sediminis TaxID=1857024 RepID=UPI002174FFCD|nr:quinone oxidoreductase [Brevibacterium sediminis]MCS4592871.1 quinone oxidoreductase [Brevibacterium sediminis]